MCTVTLLPASVLGAARLPARDGLRLRVSCNRDELLTRAPALPPAVRRAGARLAVMPIDPDSGGTWIGANDAGIVCALLNGSDAEATPGAALSRGTIIPPLLACDDLDAATSRVHALPAARYRPFRLLIAAADEFVECWSRDRRLEVRRGPLGDALMRTSSGLGDALVAGPREALFRDFLHGASDPVAAVDLFHLHQWRGREDLSVRMRRPDARTVSHTVIEIDDGSVRLSYRQADTPDRVEVMVAA